MPDQDDAIPTPPTHQGIPPPYAGDALPGFPGTFRSKAKTPFPGGKRRRWKDGDGMIYEWDYRHGRVERYSPRGDRHLGDYDFITGEQIGSPDPSRRVES